MLFVAGGSGITPILSMLSELSSRDELKDCIVVNYIRTARDVIGHTLLRELQGKHPGLRVEFVSDELSRASDQDRRRGFDEETLAELVPDLSQRSIWMCGPAGLMERASAFFDGEGVGESVMTERFSTPSVAVAKSSGAPLALTLVRSKAEIVADDSKTILEQLEAAGERPPHGCRMGICKSCRCRKRSGVVENILTGERSDRPDEDIRICISIPRGDVALEL
ncbi:MAG: ferredoxin-NADP reductase [Bradymonadia bacterium]|jgi:ferredoxin-NADP reductase